MTRLTGFSPAVRQVIKERAGISGDWVRDEISGVWCRTSEAQIHHRMPRGAGSTRRPEVNEAANGLCLSLASHALVESHRTIAVERGWLIPKLSQQMPAQVPVQLHHGLVLLGVDGSYIPIDEVA